MKRILITLGIIVAVLIFLFIGFIYSISHIDFVGKTAEQVEESNRYLNTIKLEAGYESNGYRHERIRLHENKSGSFISDSIMFDFTYKIDSSGLSIINFNDIKQSVFDTCFLFVENKKIYYKLNS